MKRLDSFLVLASQENSSLRRQLLAAGITPDVILMDAAGTPSLRCCSYAVAML